jgi:formylglycine-generating enzyme required for sulfatase activity
VLTVRRNWGPAYPASDGWPTTAPVGQFPAGAGRWGHLDLSGNVTEFVAGPYCPYDEPDCGNDEAVVRGGGYLAQSFRKMRAARRNHGEPWHRGPDVGFRCARSL